MAQTQNGMRGYSEGFVADQKQLLHRIVDGLAVYNANPDPVINMFSEPIYSETARVPQAPLEYDEEGEGANPQAKKLQIRLLSFPLRTFNLGAPFTKTGLEDALPSDVIKTAEAAMKGDAEGMLGRFAACIFTKRTAGALGTAYQASFWNGETDVPPFGENIFSGATANFKGTNNATLSRDHVIDAIEDVNEHGYGLTPGSLHAFFNIAQFSDLAAIVDATSAPIGTPERQKAIDRGFIGAGVTVWGAQVHVVPWVPAGYFAVLASDVKPLAMREHLNPANRGLQIMGPNIESMNPLVGAEYRHRYGFAVQHLGAGACRQIVASTTYTNPTMRFS